MLTRVAQEMFSVADWDFEIFQDDSGQYSFHGATVCDYFEIKNASVAIQRHVDEEWRFKAPIELGKGSDSWMIKEPGLYQLAMLSKTPMAKQFQKWVYSEVLPKLRASGGYIMPTATSDQVQALVIEHFTAQFNQIESVKQIGDMQCSSFAKQMRELMAIRMKMRGSRRSPKYQEQHRKECDADMEHYIQGDFRDMCKQIEDLIEKTFHKILLERIRLMPEYQRDRDKQIEPHLDKNGCMDYHLSLRLREQIDNKYLKQLGLTLR